MVMSKLQRRCNLCEYAACFFLGKWSFSQALTKCAAFHIGHDTVVPGTMYSIFYDGQNMLVEQGAEGFYFALKAHEVIIFAAMDHFNSHVAPRLFIKREIDLRHAPPR